MDAILPVITLTIGYFGRLLTEMFRDSRTERLVRHRKDADFQHESLIGLQDALHDAATGATGLNHRNQMRWRELQRWDPEDLPPDEAKVADEARGRLMLLASRIKDDQVRDLADQFFADFTSIVRASSWQESLDATKELVNTTVALRARAGQLIRES